MTINERISALAAQVGRQQRKRKVLRRMVSIVTSDHQPRNEAQVIRLRAVMDDFAAFSAASADPVVEAIHCGDIVNQATGELGVKAYYDHSDYFMDWAARLLPPLFALAGNHDRMATGTGTWYGAWSYAQYQNFFGPLFYTITRGNTRWVMLGDMSGATGGEQTTAALEWFENVLKTSQGFNVIVCLHQPVWGAFGGSIATYDANVLATGTGWPADQNSISEAYQWHSQRIAEAISQYDNIVAVFYGHAGAADYAAGTQAYSRFGTVFINFMMALENANRIENGGSVEIPEHYGVLYWEQGASEIELRRRDAKTGLEIPGSSQTLTTKYPVILSEHYSDERWSAARTNAHIEDSLHITVDYSKFRVETSPGFWRVQPGLLYPLQVTALDTANDDMWQGNGVGIKFNIPGSSIFGESGNQKTGVVGAAPGGAVAAERASGSDSNMDGNILLQAADTTLGYGDAVLKTVLRGFGPEGTVEVPFGLHPKRMRARVLLPEPEVASPENDANLLMQHVTDAALNFAEWGNDGVPDNIPSWFSYGFMFAFQSSDTSMGRLIGRRSGNGGMLYQNFTGGAWQIAYTVDMTSLEPHATVTTAAYDMTNLYNVQFVRVQFDGLCEITLPAPGGENLNRRITITTLLGEVESASSNVLLEDTGTLSNDLLRPYPGASVDLISNGTSWVVVGRSEPITNTTNGTRGTYWHSLRLPSISDEAFTAGTRVLLLGRVNNSAFKMSGTLRGGRTTVGTTHGDHAVLDLFTHHSSVNRRSAIRSMFTSSSTTRLVKLREVTYAGERWLALNFEGSSTVGLMSAEPRFTGFIAGQEIQWVATSTVSDITDPAWGTGFGYEYNNQTVLTRGNFPVQPAIANATSGTEIATINSILATLRTLGIIAT